MRVTNDPRAGRWGQVTQEPDNGDKDTSVLDGGDKDKACRGNLDTEPTPQKMEMKGR